MIFVNGILRKVGPLTLEQEALLQRRKSDQEKANKYFENLPPPSAAMGSIGSRKMGAGLGKK
ncbi:hypothetical protein K8Q93_00635 [Candidatus Parcubacteria bacterium]|nr:hypothetical protein [Candidatus Parcubacteria bacterium]